MPDIASLSNLWGLNRFTRSSARSGPDRPSYRGPIFIDDEVMPWGNETMLLDRLRKDAIAALAERDRDGSGL